VSFPITFKYLNRPLIFRMCEDFQRFGKDILRYEQLGLQCISMNAKSWILVGMPVTDAQNVKDSLLR
jgi:hypothetical protein